jgi:hypothetical protein
MTVNRHLLAIAAAALAGCSPLLGLDKNPTLTEPIDAAIDMKPADMMIDMDTSACAGMNCGVFGCDTTANMCRPAKLWVYLTTGAFFGNGFGGAAARSTSDTLCFTEASQNFASRACSRDRTHAIVTIAGNDSIQSMAAVYSIPTTTEIHRIDDDVLVSLKWDDMITPSTKTRAPFASTTMATDDANGIVWTGFGASNASNCISWTSKVSTDNGVIGHTTLSDSSATWLGTSSTGCNFVERLACICWSGGN